MTAGDEYFPVPTNRRDTNVFPAMVKVSMVLWIILAATDTIPARALHS
jgi:hypothetical protein